MSCDTALDAPPPNQPDVKFVLVAAVALVDDQGRVLISEHRKNPQFSGCWEFPGGKVEAGELPEWALMRELREELGIETRPTCYYPLGFASHTYHELGLHVFMPLFLCRKWRGVVTGAEGQQIKWVPPKQLYNHNLLPADIPLIAQIIDRV